MRLRAFYRVDPTEWWLTSIREIATAQESAILRPEQDFSEYIRQWVLRELVESYYYPPDWIGTRIVPSAPSPEEDFDAGQADICILTRWGEPFILVSVSSAADEGDPEERLKTRMLELPDASMGMSTDGSVERTRCIRKRFDHNKYDYILDIDSYTSRGSFRPRYLVTADSPEAPGITSGRSDARLLSSLDERFENVFFEAHSHIRDIDGMHADEALDELCKVLYAKLYDEEHPDSEGRPQIQSLMYGCTEEFAASVRHIYREATAYDVRVFGLKIPQYERSRGVFGSSIRLTSPALAKVAETVQEYDLGRSGADVKGRAFQKVIAPAGRAGMGQYFTPDPVVRFAVAVIDPTVEDLMLDPFCGSAHFLSAALQHVRNKTSDPSGKAFHEFAFGKLHGIEKSDRMVRVAMTDMRLQGDGHSNIRCTDALLALANYPDLQAESFDVILTNPPFGSLLGREALRLLGSFELAKRRSSVPLEVLGLERCIQFLRPGGRIGIVLPDGVLVNRKTSYVRNWLESQVKVRGIVSLPVETFSPFGSAIKTSILFARKWKRGEDRGADYAVFLGRIDNVGYDAAGRSREEPELDSVADAFREFLATEGW